MKKKYLFSFLLILSLMLSGCGQRGQDFPWDRPGTDGSRGEVAQESQGKTVPEVEDGVAETPGTEESSASESTSKDREGDAAESSIAEGQNGVDIMDEDGSMTLTVIGGDNLTENYVGAHFAGT